MIHRRTAKFLLIAILALSLAGCGKTVTQRTTEKAIEKATNGQADVDVGTNTVKVNVNGASWEVGEEVSLPAGFPTDVYVVDGTIKSAYKTVASNAYSAVISASKSVTDVRSLYDSKLKDDGWTITTTASVAGNEMLSAEKGNRTITVTIGTEQDQKVTAVSIFVMDKSTGDSGNTNPTTE